MGKSIPEPKAKFVCMYVREKKKKFSRYIKMQISHLKRIVNL